jgi:hypothetical protein
MRSFIDASSSAAFHFRKRSFAPVSSTAPLVFTLARLAERHRALAVEAQPPRHRILLDQLLHRRGQRALFGGGIDVSGEV